MANQQIIFVLFLIFIGAVGFSTLAILLRQTLLVAYILLGLVLGPYGASLVPHAPALSSIGEVGIVFLLFLVGLDLDSRELIQSLRQTSLITLGASFVIGLFVFFISRMIFRFNVNDSLLLLCGVLFSSTVVGVNLMPSKALFHSRRGELMISILLLQDVLAIFVLFLLHGARTRNGLDWQDFLTAFVGLPTLLFFSFMARRLIMRPLVHQFWHVKEYVFLLSIAWCLGLAELGEFLGLSAGIGAFIAGVSIASHSRTAALMRERLNPLRDFFLVLFFFSVGATFNYRAMYVVLIPGLVLTLMIVLLKPYIYTLFLKMQGEAPEEAKEVGIRLGQASEFSLLMGALATMVAPRLMSLRAEYTLQVMVLASLIISCYWVSMKYPFNKKEEAES